MVKRMDVNHISGEKLQEIADITIIFKDQNNRELWEAQIKNTNSKFFIIDKDIPAEVYNADIYFVYTHGLPRFFKSIYPNIKKPFKLISHNSDEGIDIGYKDYLNNNLLTDWYCSNKHILHNKLKSIPIGLANSQWPHGDFASMIIHSGSEKNNLVYKNFDKNTNIGERDICDHITSQNGIFMQPNRSLDEYWKKLSEAFYAISPPGNGIDCHRIWECLYLQTVPIVKYHDHFSDFIDLPILFIESWDQVTIPFLRENINKFKDVNWSIKELNIEYWKELIRKC